MKRTLVLILGALGAVALFAGLVHLVLVIAHVSEPAAATVHGATSGRIWATSAALLSLASVIVGGLSLRRSLARIGPGHGRRGAIAALVVGLIAALSGVLNLAVARGGPGSGNGVVGAAAAVVLGLTAAVLAGVVLSRAPRRV